MKLDLVEIFTIIYFTQSPFKNLVMPSFNLNFVISNFLVFVIGVSLISL